MARIILLLLALSVAGCKPSAQEQRTIRFKLDADGFASIHIKSADGRIVRTLATSELFKKGAHAIVWEGLDEQKQPLPSGEYHWSGATHTGIRAKLRGWACADFNAPWRGAAGTQLWGGDSGVPSAVAADGERVYLGWSSAEEGTAVLACDLDGRPLWGWRAGREDDPLRRFTGAKALAVDAGVVTVLGGISAFDDGNLDGTQIFKLNAHDGTPIPWSENRELTVASLWPADATTKPDRADGMAARAGRIYLTFTETQFLAVLDAQTGAYLQTVVGAPPELIDVVPTKTESNDKPGELMAADFALISLRGGVLGKVLFAHDPLWVVVSDLQPLDREERITALSVIGDGAKHHPHSAFVGLGAPFHQVQRRSVLQTEGFLWTAGRAGGRQLGPWVPEALGPIRGVALDARGRLWVAEGNAAPPRFSVWETDGTEGRLVREFVGPLPYGVRGSAVFPDDPNIFVGAGCEWRLDPQTGQSRCTGVITNDGMPLVTFVPGKQGKQDLAIWHLDNAVGRIERLGEGRYELRQYEPELLPVFHDVVDARFDGARCGTANLPDGAGYVRFISTLETLLVVSADDLVVARLFHGSEASSGKGSVRILRPRRPELHADMTEGPLGNVPKITQASDGRVFSAAAELGIWSTEITGLDSIRPLPGGKLIVRAVVP